MKPHTRKLVAIVAVSLLTLVAADAQTAAPSPRVTKGAGSAQDDDSIVLSPFTVSIEKDTGYIAADTLNAGRLSTNALMTPGSFEAMTRDFLNDLGIFGTDEASAWMTNARPLELGAVETNSMNPGGHALADSGTNVSLRGLGANPSTRNYFTSASTPKEYNVERAETARGPNAILYGEGGPGGSVNYLTKRAQKRNFTTLRIRMDDNLSKGVALDVNRKLTDKLDVRYNVNALDKRYFIDRTQFKEFDNAVSLVYRPFRNTSISVDADITKNTRPGLIMTYGEQYAKWDHQPVTAPITASATLTAKGLTNWSTVGTRSLTWIDGLGLLDFGGYARTAGYGLAQYIEYGYGDSVFPSMTPATARGISAMKPPARTFNGNPKEIEVTDHAKDAQFSIDHVFDNKLSLQLAGQYSKYEADGGNYYFTTIYMDPLYYLPNSTQLNPNYGKPFVYSYLGRNIDADRTSKSVRFVVSYPWKFLGGTTNLSMFLLHQQQGSDTAYYDKVIRTPGSTLAITSGQNQIKIFRYLDNLTPKLPDFSKMYDIVSIPTAQGINRQKTQAIEVAAAGSYLKDSLSFIAGFRRDLSMLDTLNGVTATRDARTGVFTEYTPDSRKAYNNTTTIGFVYFPIKWAGVYANHGEGFTIQTVTNKRLDGSFTKANIVPATERTAGLRFVLGHGDTKLVGSVGYYKAEQKNIPYSVGVGNINSLWRDLGLFENKDYSSRYIETFVGDHFSTGSANSITSSRSLYGSGWEASVTANLGKAFRLTVNGALPKTKQAETALDYLAYVTPKMATWTALANNAANPNRATDTTFVAQINQFISGFADGRSQDRTYKYRYNVFGVYTMPATRLKGLRLGAGVQVYGPSQIGNAIGLPYEYVYSKSYNLVSGSIGYTFRFGNRKIDVQVNVDNLLNYDSPVYNGLFAHVINGVTYNIPYGNKAIWPRAARLTLTAPF
ncbi:MAG: hypothetical protein HZA31_02030 [Opitutae bacterium]|nr:hypothetical protein [Opitutae bacterium]